MFENECELKVHMCSDHVHLEVIDKDELIVSIVLSNVEFQGFCERNLKQMRALDTTKLVTMLPEGNA